MTRGISAWVAAARVSGSNAALCLWFALSAGWLLAVTRFEDAAIYLLLVPLSLGVVAALGLLCAPSVRRWFAPSWAHVALGVGVGLATTGLTYPAFELAAELYPPLEGDVAALYWRARPPSTLGALGSLCLIVLAEEGLWRGALFEGLCRRMSPPAAGALSVLSYAVAQAGTGSWLVFGLALACGALWLWLRAATGSLLPPLLAHLIWTPTVLLFWPVV